MAISPVTESVRTMGVRWPRAMVGGALAVFGLALSITPAMAQGPASPADQEVVPPGEAAALQTITQSIVGIVNTAYAGGERPAHRDAHAKGHGCVRASFQVVPDLRPELRAGVFAQPRAYAAWIRFSNGNGEPQDDHIGDGRGMAIKLIGVEGPKLLEDEAGDTTQDFVMINHPVFFVRNAIDYVDFQNLTAAKTPGVFFASHPREGAISEAITAKVVNQMFEQRYFSMTPYRLGALYIKFSAIPVDCDTGARLTPSKSPGPAGEPDFLRRAMVAWLKTRDVCFDFAVQPQTDPATMPIEDPTVEWDESRAPFIKVASIRIPRQTFDSEAQQTFCENLSYTPWHALTDQRPVGGINRVRKVVYQTISTLRHSLNNAPRAEPTGAEAFN